MGTTIHFDEVESSHGIIVVMNPFSPKCFQAMNAFAIALKGEISYEK
jgi:hypothetical protein